MSDGDFPGAAWLESYRRRVNDDPEMSVVGEWFSTAFSLGFGEARHVVRVDRGRIVEIVSAPRFDVRTTFGLRAPVEVWRRFLSPTPPPLYHDCFAMLMRVPAFVVEGDSLVAMQNARALHRMLNVMRENGVPDA